MSTQNDTVKAKPKKELPKSRIMCQEQLNNLYKEVFEAKERGEKIGWSTSIFPQEIPETLGLCIVYPENHSAGIAARHQAEEFLQYAEGDAGYNNDLCSYAKINLAYMDMLKAPGNNMPRPDFVLCCNNICNQVTKWYQNLSYTCNAPMFMIDAAYNYEDEVTESRVKYIRNQLDQLIKDLCEFTGKTFDEDKFKEVMEISAINKDLWQKANELLAHCPSPLSGFDMFNYMSCMVCFRGKKETTDILNQLIAEIEEHIKNGTSTYPVKEEYRIFWEGIACWPYLGHNMKVMKKYGINMVATGYVKAWALDYDVNDLDGMARAYSSTSNNNNNLETIVKRRAEALKQFKCDGMIYHINRSCKVMDCQQYEVQRRLMELTGVPYTSFDGDQSDFRNYSEAQFETRIQGLVEIMKQNKEARKNG